MKRIPLTLIALILAACGTPQEQCISRALSEVKTLERRADVARGNIDRGYAIHRQSVPYTVFHTCTRKDGTRFSCPRTHVRTIERPVPIDVAEERRKLRAIETRLPALRRAAEPAIAQCRVDFPEA